MTANNSESKATEQSPAAIRVRNFLVAVAGIALVVAIFLGLQTQNPTATLRSMAEASTPYAVAKTNGKPTLLEFYANWCTTCQEMVSDMAALKQQYAEPLNFVMLNVDNSKWLPELVDYRVDGIPHFVFLNDKAEAIAQTIGNQPRSVMEENIKALIAGRPLPYAQTTGQFSSFSTPVTPAKASATDPRSHGGLPQG